MKEIIERPEGTLSESYLKYRKYIKMWRANNKEYVRNYNCQYQKKLRQDPIKFEELKMRIGLRAYLTGRWKVSYKFQSNIGMNRQELAKKYNMTEDEFILFVKSHECDHIIPASWFNNPDRTHLKPFMYRHYNLQIVPKRSNRMKHSWLDEEDCRVKLVLTLLKLDYESSKNKYDAQSSIIIKKLAREANNLKTKVKKLYS